MAVAATVSVKPSFEEIKTRLSQDEIKNREVLGTLYSINKKMKSMSQKRGALTDKMLLAKNDARGLAKMIGTLESKMDSQRLHLSRRLSAMYRMNFQSTLRLLFSSFNANDLFRHTKFLKLVSERDLELIKDFQLNLTTLREHREMLKTKVERLAKIQIDLKGQEGLLEFEQKSKSALLEKLQTHQQQALMQIKDLRKDSDVVYETAFFERKGLLVTPTEGPVRQEYGFIENPELHYKLSHKGLFLESSQGAAVRSVHRGKVVFSGPLPGNGLVVIVDHGDHYHTVYGTLSNLRLKLNDDVNEGEVLGFTSFSPFHKINGVYFEIRHFSDAIDPLPWIKNKPENQANNF